jgi:hypothetical protein
MTSAVKQFVRELGDVLYSWATVFARVALTVMCFYIGGMLLALVGGLVWQAWTAPPREHHAVSLDAFNGADNSKRLLCEQVAACKKYSEARLECAAAGNLKTCLRIKMGDDAAALGAGARAKFPSSR